MLINLIKKIKALKNNQNLDARFWVQKLLLKKSLNSADYVIANSNFTEENFFASTISLYRICS